MTRLATFATLAAIGSTLLAQNVYTSSEFIKKIAEVSGGAGGINMEATKEEHEARLATLRGLVQNAPDQAGRDAANANICVLLALTGQGEEAQKTASQIEDRQTREKRKLHVAKILGGKQAALDELNKILSDPAVPEQERIVYIEKFISTLTKDEKFDAAVSELAVGALEKTQFSDKNARIGTLLVKYSQKAVKEKVADPVKLRAVLEAVVSATPATPKTQELLDVSRQTLSSL